MPWRKFLMKLREMDEQDISVIKSWRSYPEEFKDLDYALREMGWGLTSFPARKRQKSTL